MRPMLILRAPLFVLAGALVVLGCSNPPGAVAPSPSRPTDIPAPLASSSLEAVSFSIIELGGDGTGWYYAPQLEVREYSGVDVAIVTAMVFEAGGISSPTYLTYKCVGRLEQRQLLPDLYGDYEYAFGSARRALSNVAGATVFFQDTSGGLGMLRVTGAVIPGTYPTSYRGGSPRWGC